MVTKLVPSSGRSSPTNTVLTQPVLITVTLISNLRESTSITTKPLEEDMSPELFSWTWNPEPWTQSELAPSVNSSDLTISSSVNLVPETTGPRATTPKELNLSTQSSMLPERKLKDVTASKVSKSPTLSVVEPVQVWEPF